MYPVSMPPTTVLLLLKGSVPTKSRLIRPNSVPAPLMLTVIVCLSLLTATLLFVTAVPFRVSTEAP